MTLRLSGLGGKATPMLGGVTPPGFAMFVDLLLGIIHAPSLCMNVCLKTTIAVSALALLATGYSFGLLVQDKHDRRIAAAIQLEQAMKRHKAASLGNYGY